MGGSPGDPMGRAGAGLRGRRADLQGHQEAPGPRRPGSHQDPNSWARSPWQDGHLQSCRQSQHGAGLGCSVMVGRGRESHPKMEMGSSIASSSYYCSPCLTCASSLLLPYFHVPERYQVAGSLTEEGGRKGRRGEKRRGQERTGEKEGRKKTKNQNHNHNHKSQRKRGAWSRGRAILPLNARELALLFERRLDCSFLAGCAPVSAVDNGPAPGLRAPLSPSPRRPTAGCQDKSYLGLGFLTTK